MGQVLNGCRYKRHAKRAKRNLAQRARSHDLGDSKRRVCHKSHPGTDEQAQEVRTEESALAKTADPKEPMDGSDFGDMTVLPEQPSRVTAGQ